ncbi:chorismate-binding protein [Kamptonema cortianum]|nr:chorismate-binding protein [Geitlerinema splendidum]MDK3155338.1 chorismate-binding protein [Kamptonema cortianum]
MNFNLNQVPLSRIEVPRPGAAADLFLTRHVHPQFGPGWLLFDSPSEILQANCTDSLKELLARIEEHSHDAGFAAGWLTYESGSVFDSALTSLTDEQPLACFGLFQSPPRYYRVLPFVDGELPEWTVEWSEKQYRQLFDKVAVQIQEGVTYQVNLAFPMAAKFADDWDLFCQLAGTAPPTYATFARIAGISVLSLSPELFFEKSGFRVVSKPMKGTRSRCPGDPAGISQAEELLHSNKDRAENLMIVDMVRNDMGRFAKPGTTSVDKLFEIEPHRTVWQMTSTISCESDAKLSEILAGLFPCASVTGTPKVEATRTIAELESRPRGVYTGALGYVLPEGDCRMSVPIRTIQWREDVGRYFVGSGIVADSTPESEWNECLVKAAALRSAPEPFQLLETMLFEPGSGIFLLEYHMVRMESSAQALEFKFDAEKIRSTLQASELWNYESPRRLRLLVNRAGEIELQHEPFSQPVGPLKAVLDSYPQPMSDLLACHKTTARDHLACVKERHPMQEEVLMQTENGHLCGFLKGNLVIELHGRKLTPEFGNHFLAGTYARYLTEIGEVEFAPLTVRDLDSATRFWRINSVTGWVEINLSC